MKSAIITVEIHENYLNTLFGFFHLSRKTLFQNTHQTGGKKLEWNPPHTCNLPLHKPNQADEKIAPKLCFREVIQIPVCKETVFRCSNAKKTVPGEAAGSCSSSHSPKHTGFQGNQNYKELLLKLLLGLMHSPNLFSQRMGQAIHCQPWIWRGEVKTDWQGELLSYTMLLSVTLHYFKSAKTVTWKLQPPFWRWGWGMSERKTREGKK